MMSEGKDVRSLIDLLEMNCGPEQVRLAIAMCTEEPQRSRLWRWFRIYFLSVVMLLTRN